MVDKPPAISMSIQRSGINAVAIARKPSMLFFYPLPQRPLKREATVAIAVLWKAVSNFLSMVFKEPKAQL